MARNFKKSLLNFNLPLEMGFKFKFSDFMVFRITLTAGNNITIQITWS